MTDSLKRAHEAVDRISCVPGFATVDGVTQQVAHAALEAAVEEARREGRHQHNVAKPVGDPPRCVGCGGPHPFDTTVPSPIWNRIIRGAGLPDYLCLTCIVAAFVKAGEGFTAELWGNAAHPQGVPIEVMIAGETAKSAAALSNENTQLRADLTIMGKIVDNETQKSRDTQAAYRRGAREALEDFKRRYNSGEINHHETINDFIDALIAHVKYADPSADEGGEKP